MNVPFKQYWDLLAKHIRPQKVLFGLLAVLLFTSIGLQIVNPQIMRYFIDAARSHQEMRRLVLAAAAFLGIALVQQVVSVGATYVGENVAWTATNALRAELAQHCLHLDMGFHNEHTPGELIERIDGDVQELSNFFSQLVIRVVGNMLLLVGILVVLVRARIGGWARSLPGLPSSPCSFCTACGGSPCPTTRPAVRQKPTCLAFSKSAWPEPKTFAPTGRLTFVLRGLYKLQHTILRALGQSSDGIPGRATWPAEASWCLARLWRLGPATCCTARGRSRWALLTC